ncbi:MAG: hypothetical protein WDO18_06795 [Acidobacteriota bacterium]
MLALISAGVIWAQDIVGDWQGTISIQGKELRQIFRITRNDGKLGGTLFNIDQTPQPIPLGAITMQGQSVKIPIPALGGSYDGRLDADGSITGNVTQGPNVMPLNLKRATKETAFEIPTPPAPPKPMAANAPLEFEVATIKPRRSECDGQGVHGSRTSGDDGPHFAGRFDHVRLRNSCEADHRCAELGGVRQIRRDWPAGGGGFRRTARNCGA